MDSTPLAAKRRAVNEATMKAKPNLPTCKVCQRAKCQTMRAKLCRKCFTTNAISNGGRSSGNVITGTSKKRAGGLSSGNRKGNPGNKGNTLRGQKRVKALALWTALQKITQLERYIKQANARTANSESKFSILNKARFAAKKETRQVIQANKEFVTRSVHEKMMMSAKAALKKVTAVKMKGEERSKRLKKALARCCLISGCFENNR